MLVHKYFGYIASMVTIAVVGRTVVLMLLALEMVTDATVALRCSKIPQGSMQSHGITWTLKGLPYHYLGVYVYTIKLRIAALEAKLESKLGL